MQVFQIVDLHSCESCDVMYRTASGERNVSFPFPGTTCTCNYVLQCTSGEVT